MTPSQMKKGIRPAIGLLVQYLIHILGILTIGIPKPIYIQDERSKTIFC